MKRKTKAPKDLGHLPHITLADGTVLEHGDYFRVKYEGRWQFRYGYESDGSVCAYGPYTETGTPKATAMRRTFRPENMRKDK